MYDKLFSHAKCPDLSTGRSDRWQIRQQIEDSCKISRVSLACQLNLLCCIRKDTTALARLELHLLTKQQSQQVSFTVSGGMQTLIGVPKVASDPYSQSAIISGSTAHLGLWALGWYSAFTTYLTQMPVPTTTV